MTKSHAWGSDDVDAEVVGKWASVVAMRTRRLTFAKAVDKDGGSDILYFTR